MRPSSDARPLVYHSNHQALSTVQFRRAGQLATADTCRKAYRRAQYAQTGRHKECGTRYKGSNRPHLCDACDAA